MAQARAMTDAIAYRGPDGQGHWCDPEVGIALGHRRLAIVDLSPTGLQPMISADGRVVITYNGELYNRSEMAAELAMSFRGTSDTEVLVEAIARYGIDGALERANGLVSPACMRTSAANDLSRRRKARTRAPRRDNRQWDHPSPLLGSSRHRKTWPKVSG
jgi:asparagine synthetase B (glutamine-hydrolysing)